MVNVLFTVVYLLVPYKFMIRSEVVYIRSALYINL